MNQCRVACGISGHLGGGEAAQQSVPVLWGVERAAEFAREHALAAIAVGARCRGLCKCGWSLRRRTHRIRVRWWQNLAQTPPPLPPSLFIY